MSNPPIFMGKLPIKGTFPIILKGNDLKWWGQNTDRKNYVGFTYNIPIIIYSVQANRPPAWATNKSILDGKSHALHHFNELFKLIVAM